MKTFLELLRHQQSDLTKKITVGDTTVFDLMTSAHLPDRERQSSHFILAMHAELSRSVRDIAVALSQYCLDVFALVSSAIRCSAGRCCAKESKPCSPAM